MGQRLGSFVFSFYNCGKGMKIRYNPRAFSNAYLRLAVPIH